MEKRPGKLQGEEAEAGRAVRLSDPGRANSSRGGLRAPRPVTQRARGLELGPDLAAASGQYWRGEGAVRDRPRRGRPLARP